MLTTKPCGRKTVCVGRSASTRRVHSATLQHLWDMSLAAASLAFLGFPCWENKEKITIKDGLGLLNSMWSRLGLDGKT